MANVPSRARVAIAGQRTSVPGVGALRVDCEIEYCGESEQLGGPLFKTRRVVTLPSGRRFASEWNLHTEDVTNG